MISHPVDITLSIPQIEAILNAEERGGRIITSAAVLRALHRRGLADRDAHSGPAYLTDDAREVIRQMAGHTDRRTFTLLRANGGRS